MPHTHSQVFTLSREAALVFALFVLFHLCLLPAHSLALFGSLMAAAVACYLLFAWSYRSFSISRPNDCLSLFGSPSLKHWLAHHLSLLLLFCCRCWIGCYCFCLKLQRQSGCQFVLSWRLSFRSLSLVFTLEAKIKSK